MSTNGVRPEMIDLRDAKTACDKLHPVSVRRWGSGYWVLDIDAEITVALKDGRIMKFCGQMVLNGKQTNARRGRPKS